VCVAVCVAVNLAVSREWSSNGPYYRYHYVNTNVVVYTFTI